MDVHVNDPRFDGWETLQTFEDVATAAAFALQLNDVGIDAELLADNPPDRHGRGDIFLSVPADQAVEAQELIDFPQE